VLSCLMSNYWLSPRPGPFGVGLVTPPAPWEGLLTVLRDESADPPARFEAAKAAAPYVHPRLAATQLTGTDGEDLVREQLSDYEVAPRIAFILARGIEDAESDPPSEDNGGQG